MTIRSAPLQSTGMKKNHSAAPQKKTVEWFVDQCGRVGIKATQQRRQIFDALSRSMDHPDAECIYKQVRKKIPAISLDTVYRNLHTLEKHGIIQRAGTPDSRARYDANTDMHHHFVCVECGLITDFTDSSLDKYRPPKNISMAGEIRRLRIELHGRCSRCASADKQNKTRTM